MPRFGTCHPTCCLGILRIFLAGLPRGSHVWATLGPKGTGLIPLKTRNQLYIRAVLWRGPTGTTLVGSLGSSGRNTNVLVTCSWSIMIFGQPAAMMCWISKAMRSWTRHCCASVDPGWPALLHSAELTGKAMQDIQIRDGNVMVTTRAALHLKGPKHHHDTDDPHADERVCRPRPHLHPPFSLLNDSVPRCVSPQRPPRRGRLIRDAAYETQGALSRRRTHLPCPSLGFAPGNYRRRYPTLSWTGCPALH
jgi:hypothetical protein